MIGLTLPDRDVHVVALGAHCDDIAIGCGGTLMALAASRVVHVHATVLSSTPDRAIEERAAITALLEGAASVRLDIHDIPDGRLPAHWDRVKDILEAVAAAGPAADVVFSPSAHDAHQDHFTIGRLVQTAWRSALWLQYEIPQWDGDLAQPNTYVPLREEVVERKLAILNAHYGSQRVKDWWDDEFLRALPRLRGAECRERYAEAFTATKLLLRMDASG